MEAHIDTVLGIYGAFGRGDVEHIMAQLSDDVAWDQGIRQTGLPYLQPGSGKAAVMDFFEALAQNVEFTTFEPGPPCASADTVMVAVREAGRNLTTDAAIADDLAVHIWSFGPDRKVNSFRHVGARRHRPTFGEGFWRRQPRRHARLTRAPKSSTSSPIRSRRSNTCWLR